MNLSDHINSKSMTVYQGQITNLVKWAKVLDPRPSGGQKFPDALWVICFYGHFIKCKRVKELAPVILKHRESLYQNLVLTYLILNAVVLSISALFVFWVSGCVTLFCEQLFFWPLGGNVTNCKHNTHYRVDMAKL